LEELQQFYSQFNLEDKVAIKGGSIVTRVMGEAVTQDGHVANNAKKSELRKSTRMWKESVKLRDYGK